MAVRAGTVSRIYRIDAAIEKRSTPVDFFRVGGIGWRYLGGYREDTRTQYALQSSR